MLGVNLQERDADPYAAPSLKIRMFIFLYSPSLPIRHTAGKPWENNALKNIFPLFPTFYTYIATPTSSVKLC